MRRSAESGLPNAIGWPPKHAPTRRHKPLALAQQWTRLATQTEQFGPVATDKTQDPPP